MATPAVPSQFADFEAIEGFDPIDKNELVGKPFGVTGVRFRQNARDVVFVEAEIVTEDGEELAIQDSSSGVRDQLAKYLEDRKLSYKVGGDWVDIKLWSPRGLRVSTYTVHDERGKEKQAKTYYLTTAARKRG